MLSNDVCRILVTCNAAAAWWMTGLVWFVAVVHSPLFESVGRESFPEYHARHVRRTQLVVVVPMFVELILTLLIAAFSPFGGLFSKLAWLGVASVAAVWACTFLRQVPDHERLKSGFDASVHRALVRGNYLRSVFWTTHAAITIGQCLTMS